MGGGKECMHMRNYQVATNFNSTYSLQAKVTVTGQAVVSQRKALRPVTATLGKTQVLKPISR